MTSASLKIMNPPLFPLTSSPTNARMIILASILGTLLFIIGYFLIIEILDRTLRDKYVQNESPEEQLSAHILEKAS